MLASNGDGGSLTVLAPRGSCMVLAGSKWNLAIAEYEVVPHHLANSELQAEVVDGLKPLGRQDQSRRRHIETVQEASTALRNLHDGPLMQW